MRQVSEEAENGKQDKWALREVGWEGGGWKGKRGKWVSRKGSWQVLMAQMVSPYCLGTVL